MQEENGERGGSGTRQGAVTTEVMGVQIDMVKRLYIFHITFFRTCRDVLLYFSWHC